MSLSRGDTVEVDGKKGILLEFEGQNARILRFEESENELIATVDVHAGSGKIKPLKVLNEQDEEQFFCISGKKDGSLSQLSWETPLDIVKELLPHEAQAAATPSRRSRRLAATPSRRSNRNFEIAPKSLFDDDDDDVITDFEDSSDDEDDHDELELASRSTRASPRKAPARRSPVKRAPSTPKKTPETPRKRKAASPYPTTPKHQRAGRGRSDVDQELRSLPTTPRKNVPQTPRRTALASLHVSNVPESLPCRDKQFSELFRTLESAIQTTTGTCIYVSGTPGTGKTSTIREAIEQLYLRLEEGELQEFDVLEINGMRLVQPTHAYELLYDGLDLRDRARGQDHMSVLEAAFSDPKNNRKPMIVVMDELDQLITKDQSVIYNFFNWPTLPHSRFIVVAISNTFDMPERVMQNKIKSRVGLTRIEFPGYSYQELQQILHARLDGVEIIQDDAIEHVARKIGSVSGDARRVLDICRHAIELVPDGEMVSLEIMRRAIHDSESSAAEPILSTLSLTSKIVLLSMYKMTKQTKEEMFSVNEIIQQCRELARGTGGLARYDHILFNVEQVRIQGYQHAVLELIEGGVVSQEYIRGDTTALLRLNMDISEVKSAIATEELRDVFRED